jgi:hypothetical protein
VNGSNWQSAGKVAFRVSGSQMELKIPKALLKLKNQQSFQFKWSDNMQKHGDVMDFLLNGDVAPLGRFNYEYQLR